MNNIEVFLNIILETENRYSSPEQCVSQSGRQAWDVLPCVMPSIIPEAKMLLITKGKKKGRSVPRRMVLRGRSGVPKRCLLTQPQLMHVSFNERQIWLSGTSIVVQEVEG